MFKIEEQGLKNKGDIQEYLDKFEGMGTLLEILNYLDDEPFGMDTFLFIVRTTTGIYAIRATDGPRFDIDWDDLSPWILHWEKGKVRIKRYIPLKNPMVDDSFKEFGVFYENKYTHVEMNLAVCIAEADNSIGRLNNT